MSSLKAFIQNLLPSWLPRRERIDLLEIALISLMLPLIGVISLTSALGHLPPAEAKLMIFKQVLFYVLGIGTALILYMMKPEILEKIVPAFTLFTIFLLILPLTPLGVEAGGARAWVRLGPFNFQPSELAKIAIILYTAYFTTKKSKWLEDYRRGFLPPLLLLGTYLFLLNLEPDLGNAMIITAIFLATMYAGGTRSLFLLGLISFFSLVFTLLILQRPYRMMRITAFINPWADRYGSGYNIIQSLIAHGRGGLWGVGLGSSIQKLYYLPEHHTDFIYSIIGEELGLLGTVGIALLYLALFLIAIRVALRTNQKFVKMVAFGVGFAIGIQALINMGMTVSMFPVTGITLPLISYGGTSVLVTFMMIGILANFIKNAHSWDRGERSR